MIKYEQQGDGTYKEITSVETSSMDANDILQKTAGLIRQKEHLEKTLTECDEALEALEPICVEILSRNKEAVRKANATTLPDLLDEIRGNMDEILEAVSED